MFSNKVYKWNAVDVSNRENGRYRTRGIVVDKTETGLLVDFDILNKEPQLIAFDRITHDANSAAPIRECGRAYKDCGDYDVLLQLSAGQPWMWYPAEKLAGTKYSFDFELVKAEVSPGRSITTVVRKTLVRCRCFAKHRRAVLVSDYLKKHVDMPCDDFVSSPTSPLFRKLWTDKSYLARTYPIGIADKKFYYMQRRHDDRLDPSKVVSAVEEITRESTLNKRGLKRSYKESDTILILTDTLHHHINILKTQSTITMISYDVLRSVLSHLDAVESVRYRRVCSLWDLVIASLDSTTVVIYDMSACIKQDIYVLASVLVKRVKQTTKYLIFTGPAAESMTMSSQFVKSMEVTGMILDQIGIIIPTLVLVDMEMSKFDLLAPSSFSKDDSIAIFESLHRICRRLMLVRGTLCHLFPDDDYTGDVNSLSPYWNLKVLRADMRMFDTTQWVLRDALEQSAQQSLKSEFYKELLSEWINGASDVITGKRKSRLPSRKQIMQVLQTWEGDDPRFGPACTVRGLSWNDLGAAQLSKLVNLHSVTVMCLLYKLKQHRRMMSAPRNI